MEEDPRYLGRSPDAIVEIAASNSDGWINGYVVVAAVPERLHVAAIQILTANFCDEDQDTHIIRL